MEGYDDVIQMFWFSFFIFPLKADVSPAFAWLSLRIDPSVLLSENRTALSLSLMHALIASYSFTSSQ